MLFSLVNRVFLPQIINNVTKRSLGVLPRYNNLLFTHTKPCTVCASQHVFINPIYTSFRFYAKGKDKKKEKGKKKVEINETQLAEIINIETLRTQMKKSVDTLKDEYIKNLSLRSTTGAIDSVQINLDGKEYPLQELAQIVRKNPNTVIINLSTFPQAIPAVLKALSKSGMNLNPQQDGTTLFIPVPKVTKEHRENLAKNAKTLFIKCKDHIRDTQMKFSKNVKKQENLATDLVHSVQDQIAFIGDQYIAEAEKVLVSKQTELLGKE